MDNKLLIGLGFLFLMGKNDQATSTTPTAPTAPSQTAKDAAGLEAIRKKAQEDAQFALAKQKAAEVESVEKTRREAIGAVKTFATDFLKTVTQNKANKKWS